MLPLFIDAMSVVSFAVFVIILNFRYATTMAEIPLISDIPKEDNNIVMNELKVSVNSIIGNKINIIVFVSK